MRQMILCLGDQTMHSMFSQELRLLSILLVAKMIGILISPIIKTHFILWVKLVVRFCQLLAPSSTWDLDVDEASSATVNQLTIISICLREQRRILEHEYYLNHQQQNPFCHCCNSIDWWKKFMTDFFFLFHTLLSVARCQPYAKRKKLAFWCLRYRSLGYWGFVRWSNPTLVQFTERAVSSYGAITEVLLQTVKAFKGCSYLSTIYFDLILSPHMYLPWSS